jgi:hypothetical protein
MVETFMSANYTPSFKRRLGSALEIRLKREQLDRDLGVLADWFT